MTILGIVLVSIGNVACTWGVAGLADRQSRSEDDWPLFWSGVSFVVAGVIFLATA